MKVLLFDIDETLLEAPRDINVVASEEMFVRVFGVKLNEEMIQNSGKTEKGIITEVLQTFAPKIIKEIGEIPQEAYEVWGEATKHILTTRPPAILPGVLDFLRVLSEDATITLALLTGNAVPRAEAKLQAAGIDKFFRDKEGTLRGAFGNEVMQRSDLLALAQKRLGSVDSTFILVDDSLIGARMAKEYALPSIFVTTGRSTKDELEKFVPIIFRDFGEERWKDAVKIIASFA